MPNWEGIEDAATMLPRIWLTRAKDSDVWKPLRKIDCKALNESRGKFIMVLLAYHLSECLILFSPVVLSTNCMYWLGEEILIEGGRAIADPKSGTMRFNFVSRPETKLMSATWFIKEEKKNQKEFILHPLPESDSWQVELLYQNAVRASSSLGEGLDDILKKDVVLESEPNCRVSVVNNGGLLSMRKRPLKSSFLGFGEVQVFLQRGYGQYTIEGEDDENALGEITHAIFVIHGIGEAMWNREEVRTMSMVEELDLLRMTVNKKKIMAWRDECKKCEKQK